MKKIKKIFFYFLLLFLSTILYSCGNKIKFKVNFIVDDSIYATIKTSGKEIIEIPSNPSKEGYTFEGWYWDKEIWLKPFTAKSLLEVSLSENMNVYAKFIDNDDPIGTDLKIKDEFNPIYSKDDNSWFFKVSNNTKIFSMSDCVNISNKSIWTLSKDISGNDIISSKTIELELGNNEYYIQVNDQDTNKIKQYKIIIRRKPIYTVYFDTNGGSICEIKYVEEDDYIEEPKTSKIGYTFKGWNYNFASPITENMTIIADWTPNIYSIRYDPNGGDISTTYEEVEYGSLFIPKVPIRKGYLFKYWYNDEIIIHDNGIWTYPLDLEVKAMWTPCTYKISYELNGGKMLHTSPKLYSYGSSIIIENPIKEGYEFKGWIVNGEIYNVKDYEISPTTLGDINLEAIFEPKSYNITFDTNGGSCRITELIVKYNEKYYLPTPERKGYIFKGWYNKSTLISDGTWKKTSDLVVTAKWETIKYKIKYNLDGGQNVLNPMEYTIETDTIVLNDAYKKGYLFLGWTTASDDIPKKNIKMEHLVI